MSVRGTVLDHMKSHRGITVSLDTLAGTYGFDQRQVQKVMSWAMRNGALPGLEVVEKGQVWSYRRFSAANQKRAESLGSAAKTLDSKRAFVPPGASQTFAEAAGVDPVWASVSQQAPPDRTIPKLTAVRRTKAGAVVLEDEDGGVWVAAQVFPPR